MSITIFDQQFKLADIRKIIKKEFCNKAERKLARTLADQIQEIALIMEIPGNLYLKIQKQNCPSDLRTLNLETFKKKGNPNNKKTTYNEKSYKNQLQKITI